METVDGMKRPLRSLNKLQEAVLGNGVRLSPSDLIELVDWISSLEDELLAVREQIAENLGSNLQSVHATPQQLRKLIRHRNYMVG